METMFVKHSGNVVRNVSKNVTDNVLGMLQTMFKKRKFVDS